MANKPALTSEVTVCLSRKFPGIQVSPPLLRARLAGLEMILSGASSLLKAFFSGIVGSSIFPTCLLYEVDGGGRLDPEAIWGSLYSCSLWEPLADLFFVLGRMRPKPDPKVRNGQDE